MAIESGHTIISPNSRISPNVMLISAFLPKSKKLHSRQNAEMAQQESATAAGGRVSITRERLVAANRDDSGAQRELLDEAVRVLLAFTPAPSTKVDKPLVTTNADPYVDLVDDAEPTDTDDDDDAGLQDDDDEAGSDDNDDNNEYCQGVLCNACDRPGNSE